MAASIILPGILINTLLEIVNSKPCIIHVFVGSASQQFEGESIMFSLFNEKRITYKNANRKSLLFSEFPSNNASILNDSVLSSLRLRDSSNYDILYVPIYLAKNVLEIRHYCSYFDCVKPDYIIMQTEYSYDNFDELQYATRYICNHELDIWVKSKYYHYQEKGIFSYQNEKCSPDFSIDINDNRIRDKIAFDMISKMTFPRGIKKY